MPATAYQLDETLFKIFSQGFLIIAPISITMYLILVVVNWLNQLFDLAIPGLRIVAMVFLFTLVGYIGSSFLVRPFLLISERRLNRVPIVSIIYSSIKDLFDAFVGNNQKFSRPVMVKMNEYALNLSDWLCYPRWFGCY